MPNAHRVAGASLGVLLALLLTLGAIAPLAVALDTSARAIRVVGSSTYPDSVQSYSGEVNGFTGEFNGQGIGIAVLDTGVDDQHPTFDGAWVAGAELGTWPECPLGVVQCFRTQDPVAATAWNPDDVNGHGTHVASIALGRGGAGVGPRGVASGARLIEVKIASDLGGVSIGGVAGGIDWVIAYNNGATSYGAPLYPARVISISFASLTPHDTKDYDEAMLAVKRAWDNGILVVAAAGNCGPGAPGDLAVQCDPTVNREDGNTITSPGAAPDALTVGAVDDNAEPDDPSVTRNGDIVAPYSSRGPNPGDSVTDVRWRKPDVVAPGSRIEAACAATTPGDQHPTSMTCSMSGTSMATPHVSGVAAILFQASRELGLGFTAESVKDLILTTADDWTEVVGWDASSGYGYVDAYKAIVEAVNRPPHAQFSFSPQRPLIGQEVTFDASTTTDPDAQDTIDRFEWDFGDETDIVEVPGTVRIAKHTYDAVGPYTVRLTATDSRGSSDTDVRTVDVDPLPEEPLGEPPVPVITYWPKRPVAGEPMSFDARNSSDPDEDKLVKFEWDFDHKPGSLAPELSGPQPKVEWTFGAPGAHRVALRVVDEAGLGAIGTIFLTVAAPPPDPPVIAITNPKEGDAVQAGPILLSWVVKANPADAFTVYLDSVQQFTVGSLQARQEVTPGAHTLKVVARGPGGTGTAWTNFTAVGDESLESTSASTDCTSHTHADGATETHCPERTSTGAGDDTTGGPVDPGEPPTDAPAAPLWALLLVVAVAALGRRRRFG